MSLCNSFLMMKRDEDDVEESITTLEVYIEMMQETIENFKKRSNPTIGDKNEVTFDHYDSVFL